MNNTEKESTIPNKKNLSSAENKAAIKRKGINIIKFRKDPTLRIIAAAKYEIVDDIFCTPCIAIDLFRHKKMKGVVIIRRIIIVLKRRNCSVSSPTLMKNWMKIYTRKYMLRIRLLHMKNNRNFEAETMGEL